MNKPNCASEIEHCPCGCPGWGKQAVVNADSLLGPLPVPAVTQSRPLLALMKLVAHAEAEEVRKREGKE